MLQPIIHHPDRTSSIKSYGKFYREVGTHGEKVVKKHEEDLNVTLVFVRGMTTFDYCHPLVHFTHPPLVIAH